MKHKQLLALFLLFALAACAPTSVQQEAQSTEIINWILAPTLVAENIQPSILPSDYQIAVNPEKNEVAESLYSVSVITIDQKRGLIDFSGNLVLPADFDTIFYDPVALKGLGAYDSELNVDYGINEDYTAVPFERGGVGGGSALYWNTFDASLYLDISAPVGTLLGPIQASGPMPAMELNYNISTLERDDSRWYEASHWLYHPAAWDLDVSSAVGWANYDDLDGGIGEIDGLYPDWETRKYGYADSNRVIIPFEFERAQFMHESIGAARKDGLWYYYDSDGNCLTPNGYSDAYEDENFHNGYYAYDFSCGLAAVNRDGLWGYIDASGTEVISCQYEATRPVYHGLAWVKEDGTWGIADLTAYMHEGE